MGRMKTHIWNGKENMFETTSQEWLKGQTSWPAKLGNKIKQSLNNLLKIKNLNWNHFGIVPSSAYKSDLPQKQTTCGAFSGA